MAYTKTVSKEGYVTITAGNNALSVSVQIGTVNQTWETLETNTPVEPGDSFSLSNPIDGLYRYLVTESNVTTGFYHICYPNMKESLLVKIQNIVNYPSRSNDLDIAKYDFMALILIGFRYLNTEDIITDGAVAEQASVPDSMQDMNAALLYSAKYLSTHTIHCNPM